MPESSLALRLRRSSLRFLSLAMFLLLLLPISGFGQAQVSKIASCPLTNAEAASIDVDAATNVHAMSDYRKSIYAMFMARRFRQLDCLAEAAQRHKETFTGGMWKLNMMFRALREPTLHPTEQDWKKHMLLVREWAATRPKSITARVALAESYLSYGWDARGNGESDTVSNSGWKIFEQRVGEARKTLNDASKLPDKCAEWYLAMQMVALAQGWEQGKRDELLKSAVAFEPGYFYYYRTHAASILPKWYGREGQVEEFAKSTADRIGGDAGDVVYFQITSYIVCCQTDDPLKFSWIRIQKGFKALEKQSGEALQNSNYLARMATVYGDPLMASRMFERIGDQWDEEIWRTSSYFQSTREWAKQMSRAMERQRTVEDIAQANLATPQGQHYQNLIEEKLRAALPGCVKTIGRDNGRFEILFKVKQDGSMTEMMTYGYSRVGMCVLKNAAQSPQEGKPPAFPAPPKPDYWVRFDLDLDGLDATAMK